MPLRERQEIQEVLRIRSRVKTYQNVIFDLGGVLIDWNPRYLYRELISSESEMEYFLEHVCNSQWNEKQDAGRKFAEAETAAIAQFPAHESLIRAYFARWPEMIAGEIPGTSEILKSLHKQGRHGLYALSNWSAETFPVAQERFPFLQLFRSIVLSGEVGLVKPNPQIYQHLLEKHHVDPRSAVFIDDVKKNTDAAKALGIDAILFTSATDLAEQLRRRHILS